MAIKTVQTSIAINDPQGNALVGGSITLDLSQPAIVTGGGDIVPTRVSLPLDSTGKIAGQPVNLWANDQLSPGGTIYRMRFFNSNNLLVADFGNVSIVGAAPIDLSLLTPILSSPALLVTNVPQIVASVDLVGQTVAVGLTTFYTIPSASMYRMTVEPVITSPGNGVNLTANIQYNLGQSNVTPNIPANQNGIALGTFSVPDSFSWYASPGDTVKYGTSLSGSIGVGTYALHIRLERLF